MREVHGTPRASLPPWCDDGVPGPFAAPEQHADGLAAVDAAQRGLQLLAVADVHVADAQDDVALAQARTYGRALRRVHAHAALELELAALRLVEVAHGQAQRRGGRARRGAAARGGRR